VPNLNEIVVTDIECGSHVFNFHKRTTGTTTGGWPGFNELKSDNMDDVERISLQQFPWK